MIIFWVLLGALSGIVAVYLAKVFDAPPGLDRLPEVKTPSAPLPDIRVHVVPCMGGWTAYYAGEVRDTVPVWSTKKEAKTA